MNPRVLLVALLLGVLLWLLFVWAVTHDGITTRVAPRTVPVVMIEPDPWTTTTTETPTTERPELPRSHTTAPTTLAGGAMLIASTGYCETGLMADGLAAHDGAVSSHVLARGSRWRVLDGEFAGRVFTVEDTGPLATFDIAMPGRCDEARAYGRRLVHIEASR